MVVDFLEGGECGSSSPAGDFFDATEMNVVETDCTAAVGEIRRMVALNDGYVEPYRELLVGDVMEAAASSSNGDVSRRRLVMILRELHHDAAICKTKWGGSHGVAAGDYEFIDVVSGKIRYLIDTNFSAQFEIARPTIQYTKILKFLPLIFIGTAEELKKIVRIMCDAAKRSLNLTNLIVPPWRRNGYMQNKWLGPYRRTVNPISDTFPTSTSKNTTQWQVKCRWIGFDDTSSMEVVI
ncbi:uncharacterized protein LOC111796130 isoform X1 [Cucurbita pepo subsp. pepo]|uniref:uncharacterized protein LOC111796130 isoform X1 n=2 Tax=Cucurbita pepo subsp. pepo TaxID=3664 RepID=UPI000C9D346C|nr:uncharacterized protein LOC111796130 isoform X1 [Cucurbita pepo subsp. pepo]